jgi:hypothetical protein
MIILSKYVIRRGTKDFNEHILIRTSDPKVFRVIVRDLSCRIVDIFEMKCDRRHAIRRFNNLMKQ